MSDHYLTLIEISELLAIFSGPFLIIGGTIQYILLRHLIIRKIKIFICIGILATLTVALTIFLLFVMPVNLFTPSLLAFGYGSTIIVPAMISTIVVTISVSFYLKIFYRHPSA